MVLDPVELLIGGEGPEVVRECRRCGTTVDGDLDQCPHCGPEAELVQYEID